MENQKLLDVVALAAQLQAVACEENDILSVTYDKYGTQRNHVMVHVSSPEMVDAVSSDAKLGFTTILNFVYYARKPHITVFSVLSADEAMAHTGKNYAEILELMEDHTKNGFDLY